MEINTLSLRFSGDKADLKNQLDEWCEKANKTRNGTVIELIQLLIEAGSIEKINK